MTGGSWAGTDRSLLQALPSLLPLLPQAVPRAAALPSGSAPPRAQVVMHLGYVLALGSSPIWFEGTPVWGLPYLCLRPGPCLESLRQHREDQLVQQRVRQLWLPPWLRMPSSAEAEVLADGPEVLVNNTR